MLSIVGGGERASCVRARLRRESYVTVAGTVKEFRFVNPHAMLVMDVKDEAGNVVKWTVEFAGRLNLTNAVGPLTRSLSASA